MTDIILRHGKGDSLKRFHPWVFSGAIFKIQTYNGEELHEGDVVRVVESLPSAEGYTLSFVALGHYQIGSIAVRVLSFEDRPINRGFWLSRLKDAWAVRQRLDIIRDDNTMFRMVHGEGDQLPGLIIDVYGDTAVMQAHSVGMHHARSIIAEVIGEATGGRIRNVYYKSETTLPYMAHLNAEDGFILGHSDTNVARENGLQFHIDWLEGQKTGFFVDQRDNRSLVESYAKGKNVLNMFCYTGGFSVYAMRGGANNVHSVDASAKAIELTNANVALNFPDDGRHEAFCEDAFKYLERAGGDYDMIILDPPAFAKHKDALRNALKGYTRLNAIAFKKIRPGGIVFTFSCSQAVNKDQFRLAVFTAAAQSGRHVRILHQLHQPADHPINIYHPEGEYLKGLVLYVE